MKKPLLISLCAFVALVCLAATVTVSPGKRIRDYPNNGMPSTNARYIMEKGDGSTNENISHLQLMYTMTNALTPLLSSLASTSSVTATITIVSNSVTTFVITTSNNIVTNVYHPLEIQTNTVRLGLVTNNNWTYGVTGSVSSSTARLGVDDSPANTVISNAVVNFTLTTSNSIFNLSQSAGSNLVVVLTGTNTLVTMTSTNGTNFYVVNSTASGGGGGTGSTNFINLSAQAAKLPSTNYPGIDAGWTAWETVYYETNAEGNRATLEANWQVMVPPDYATNSMQLLINYSLLATNGPNTSNVIFGASFLPVRSGTTNNVHTNAFGFTAFGTNNWIAKYDGTNSVTNLVISLGTNAALNALDLGVLKLSRDAVNDTYGGAVAVHGLQLIYTRQ